MPCPTRAPHRSRGSPRPCSRDAVLAAFGACVGWTQEWGASCPTLGGIVLVMSRHRLTEEERQPAQLVARFESLYDALSEDSSWEGKEIGARYAAVTLLGCEGAPDALAGAVREMDAGICQAMSWFKRAHPYVRAVLAATLVKFDVSCDDFFKFHEHATEAAGQAKLSYKGHFALLASLVLRTHAERSELTVADMERMRELFNQMKVHHWWLTGADDLPPCAMLMRLSGSGKEIETRAESMYGALKAKKSFSPGNALQRASHLLTLSALAPEEAGDRAEAIVEALESSGVHVNKTEYDEVALLAALDASPEVIGARVAECVELVPNARVRDEVRHVDVAASVALLSLDSAGSGEAGVDLKILLDVQTAAGNQQAATAGAVRTGV